MKTAPSPAFMFYASDIMADKRYRLMELHERGLLITLKCECWVNGSAPADPDELARWLGFEQEKIKSALTQRVLDFFKVGNGELIDPAIEKYRTEILLRRQKLSKAGKKGVKAKQEKSMYQLSHPASHPSSLAQATRVEMKGEESNGDPLSRRDHINDPWVLDYERASNGA